MKLTAQGRPQDPFSAALETLRAQLRGGQMVMGEPLTITDLAEEMGLSVTPVREAMSRLAGEGLIEDRRGRGFFARRIDVADLVELYEMRELYLVAALRRRGSRPHQGHWQVDPGDTILFIFERLIAEAGDQTLLKAYREIGDRLAPAVAAEPAIADIEVVDQAIMKVLVQKAANFSSAITDYHNIRQIRSGEIVRAIRARANISPS